MTHLARALGLTSVFLFSCSTSKVKNSPETVDVDRRAHWLATYRAARAGDVKACPDLAALKAEADFPAAPLAALRAFELCPDQSLDRGQLPPYLRELGLDIALKHAQGVRDHAAEMDLAAEMARRKLPQREKLTWIKLALQRARELNLAPKIQAFTIQMYQIAPRLNPQPKPSEFLAVAADFRQAREFGPARRYFEKVVAGSGGPEDKIAALRGLRLSFKNARDVDGHLRAARRLSSFVTRIRALQSKSPKLRLAAYDARAYEARATWTAGHPAVAGRLLASLELEVKDKPARAEVYWLRARLAEEARDYKEVARYLELARGLNAPGPIGDKVLWYAAWNERARGNPAAALEHLRAIDQGTKDESARVRALYWIAQILRETKDGQADDAFKRVITADPLGYYGLLAHRQLGAPIHLASRPTPLRRRIAPTLDAGLADWLVLLDERDALASLVDEAASSYARRSDQDDEAWTDLLQQYARAGLYLKLFEGLARLTPERRRAVLDAQPDLLFPRPWPEVVSTAAKAQGIDEALIYAIMRQESAFDAHARSVADAFGLMQLIPEVAGRLAKRVPVDYQRPEDMFEPETVIPLGAAHLRELSDRYQGRLILLSAAYNASDDAIRGWVQSRFRGDPVAFIEEIPFEETRTYVRLVMRNLIFYRLLRANGAGLPFPDEVLAMGPGSLVSSR